MFKKMEENINFVKNTEDVRDPRECRCKADYGKQKKNHDVIDKAGRRSRRGKVRAKEQTTFFKLSRKRKTEENGQRIRRRGTILRSPTHATGSPRKRQKII